jgi:alcohol dehydrogenase class IV
MIDKNAENLLSHCEWSFPVPIAYGPGRLAELGPRAMDMGLANALIVTDRGSAQLPFIGALQRALKATGISSDVFADVAPNPKDTNVASARQMYRQGGHDAVIAIGGGSGMDAGKATALTA